MKKYIMTIVMALGFGMGLNAQNDGFFSNSNYSEYRDMSDDWANNMPVLPSSHGSDFDYSAVQAPLGTGLLLLAGMGIGYASMRKRD